MVVSEGREQKRNPLIVLDERVPRHKAAEGERGSLKPGRVCHY